MLLKDILAISTKLNLESCLWTENNNKNILRDINLKVLAKLGKITKT